MELDSHCEMQMNGGVLTTAMISDSCCKILGKKAVATAMVLDYRCKMLGNKALATAMVLY